MTNALMHGTWWSLKQRVPVEDLMEGRFTQLFPHAAAADFSDDALQALAEAMTSPAEDSPTPETEIRPRGEPGHRCRLHVPRAVHRPRPHLRPDVATPPSRITISPPDQIHALADFRTPRFDLDNVYGRGPADQPYLYAGRRRPLPTRRATVGQPARPARSRRAPRPQRPSPHRRSPQRREPHRRATPVDHAALPQPSRRRTPQRELRRHPRPGPLALPVGRRQRLPPHDHQRPNDPEHLPAPRRPDQHLEPRAAVHHRLDQPRHRPRCPSSSPSPPTGSGTR